MNDSGGRMKPGREPYMMLDRLQLRCYLPHEIERLSVLRITETKTFDEVYTFLW